MSAVETLSNKQAFFRASGYGPQELSGDGLHRLHHDEEIHLVSSRPYSYITAELFPGAVIVGYETLLPEINGTAETGEIINRLAKNLGFEYEANEKTRLTLQTKKDKLGEYLVFTVGEQDESTPGTLPKTIFSIGANTRDGIYLTDKQGLHCLKDQPQDNLNLLSREQAMSALRELRADLEAARIVGEIEAVKQPFNQKLALELAKAQEHPETFDWEGLSEQAVTTHLDLKDMVGSLVKSIQKRKHLRPSDQEVYSSNRKKLALNRQIDARVMEKVKLVQEQERAEGYLATSNLINLLDRPGVARTSCEVLDRILPENYPPFKVKLTLGESFVPFMKLFLAKLKKQISYLKLSKNSKGHLIVILLRGFKSVDLEEQDLEDLIALAMALEEGN